jgi:hypothetical protein
MKSQPSSPTLADRASLLLATKFTISGELPLFPSHWKLDQLLVPRFEIFPVQIHRRSRRIWAFRWPPPLTPSRLRLSLSSSMQGFPMSLWSYQGHRHTLVEAGMGAALADGRPRRCLGEREKQGYIYAQGREERKKKNNSSTHLAVAGGVNSSEADSKLRFTSFQAFPRFQRKGQLFGDFLRPESPALKLAVYLSFPLSWFRSWQGAQINKP